VTNGENNRAGKYRSVAPAGERREYPQRATAETQKSGHLDGLSRATAATSLALLVGAVAAWTVVSVLLARKWPWELYGNQASQSDVLKLALGMVAATGAAIALIVNYRRQQHLERDDAGRRDQARLFTERFGAAAAQLGGSRPAVRLAGVYAMAALADEWDTQRQQCINVLCGYLRLPYPGEPPPGQPELVVELRQYAGGTIQRTETTTYQAGEIQVRSAIVDTIRQRLQPASRPSWSNLDFAFNGAFLVDASFEGATFCGQHTSFEGARFSGQYASFERAMFSSQRTSFAAASFSSQRTSFAAASFSSQRTSFTAATFSSQRTWFGRAIFSSEGTWFDGATFSGEEASFAGVTFAGQRTRFDNATFAGQYTWFERATFSGQRTRFDNATFSSENTSFRRARFTDVDGAMREARIIGGSVDWGPVPPRSPWPASPSESS